MARQWDDLRDLWQLQSIAPDKFDSLKVNGALFAAGVCVNFALWGIDILGAYHVAKEERDYVIYRYGLARSSTGSADPALEVIRSQFRRDDALARPRTAASALRYLEGDPRSRAFGEVSYYLAVLLVRLGEPDEAFAHLLRGLAVDPSSPYAFALRSAAVDLLTKYWLRWHADRALLWETLQSGTGGGPGGDEGLVALVELAPRIANRRIVEMLWLFADRYLASSTRPADGDRVLVALGTSFARLRRTELEAAAWAKLLTFYPESPMRDEALRRAIEAYRAREDSAAVEKLGTLEREGE